MRSTLFKTIFAGAVAAGALLLSGSAAQAAGAHHPCDGPGFGDGAFLGDRFGFPDDDFGMFGDDDFGFFHRRDDRPTVIVVTVHDKTRHHHHKPASPGGATSNGHASGNSNGGSGYGSRG